MVIMLTDLSSQGKSKAVIKLTALWLQGVVPAIMLIGLGSGLVPDHHQAITWTNDNEVDMTTFPNQNQTFRIIESPDQIYILYNF